MYRKLSRWQEAEETYLKALSLQPGQASTFTSLGYTYHLQVVWMRGEHYLLQKCRDRLSLQC